MHLHTIPASYSLLSPTALREFVQSNWQFATPVQCELFQTAQSGGNDLYLIKEGMRRYLLKLYLNRYSENVLEARAGVLDILAQNKIPVNQPIQRPGGSFTIAIQAAEGIRYLHLFAFTPGEPPGADINEAQAKIYGQTIAQMHEFMDHQTAIKELPKQDEEQLLLKPIHTIKSFPHLTAGEKSYLDALQKVLWQRLASLPRTTPGFGFCHGDLHKNNLLYTSNHSLTLIDFDCMCYSWRAYELSVLFWSTNGLKQAHQTTEAYLKGYQSVYPLSHQTLELIPWFVIIRHLWWMAIDLVNIQQGRMGNNWLTHSWFEHHIAKLQGWEQQLSKR